MIGVFQGTDRIGTVARFAGNRPSERFFAWSIHSEARQGFRLQREAIAWLGKLHHAAGERAA